MKTICLNMIVKNESSVIIRCLESVQSLIDCWVIVDTGSTDGTQELIRQSLKAIPGELVERPWIDFAHNRNEALDLARNRADYILFIDADEKLIFSKPFNKSDLKRDYYLLQMVGKTVDFRRIFLIKNDPEWRWVGVLHEFVTNPNPVTGEVLSGIAGQYNHVAGHRSRDLEKSKKDLSILRAALIQDPQNSRYVFYLAQTLAASGQYFEALEQYQKRVSMGSGNSLMDKEEVFWSLYQMGCIESDLQMASEKVIDRFMKAIQFDETRAEPYYRLSVEFQLIDSHILGYLLIKEALTLPKPNFYIRLQRSVYDYLLQLKLAEFSYLIGNIEESRAAYRELLANAKAPEETKEMARKNLIGLSYENDLSQYDRQG